MPQPRRSRARSGEIPYPSFAYPHTSPVHLATLARLAGLDPPDPRTARVLEVGCASGGNLLSMANSLADARFVGLDISASAIREARRVARSAGLRNVRVDHLDFRELDPGAEPFDYILCHGVYSWVSGEAQEALLSLCAKRLTPTGLCYLSYNVGPGWRLFSAIRDMMMHAAGDTARPRERLRRARGFLQHLAASLPAEDGYYGRFVHTMQEFLAGSHDGYVLQDFLAPRNEAILFGEFVSRARAHGLRYAFDARQPNLDEQLPPDLPVPRGVDARHEAAEQYRDFLSNAGFRESVFHIGSRRLRRWAPGNSASVYAAAELSPEHAALDVLDPEPSVFCHPDGVRVQCQHAVTRCALLELRARHPASVRFDQLLTRARQRVAAARAGRAAAPPGTTPPPLDLAEDRALLADNLLRAYLADVRSVQLAPDAARPAIPTLEPWVSHRLARHQAGHAMPVTNLLHQRVPVDSLDRALIPLLDGTRDRAAVLGAIVDMVRSGELALERDGAAFEVDSEGRGALAEEIDGRLEFLRRNALLMAS